MNCNIEFNLSYARKTWPDAFNFDVPRLFVRSPKFLSLPSILRCSTYELIAYRNLEAFESDKLAKWAMGFVELSLETESQLILCSIDSGSLPTDGPIYMERSLDEIGFENFGKQQVYIEYILEMIDLYDSGDISIDCLLNFGSTLYYRLWDSSDPLDVEVQKLSRLLILLSEDYALMDYSESVFFSDCFPDDIGVLSKAVLAEYAERLRLGFTR